MIRELTIFEFEEFANSHVLSNYYQSKEYATISAQKGFEYEYIGYTDSSDKIMAAALVLYKKIGMLYYYGYAPKGFLIDYMDFTLVSVFTQELKNYYAKRNFAFIKINPELAIGEVDCKNDYTTIYNDNIKIKNCLINLGYIKLKDNLYFEAAVPRFNAILPIKKLSIDDIGKNARNKVKNGIRKGLELNSGSKFDIDKFFDLIKDKNIYDANYYKDYYNIFSKVDKIDLFFVKINYEQYLLNSRDLYEQELQTNSEYNKDLMNNNSNINKKMQSDKLLLSYKNDISEATSGLGRNTEEIIAGALVVKHGARINILLSGFDKSYKKFQPNYFLHYKIFEFYKDDFAFADLNGVVGNFSNNNPYSGLNRFKLGWNAKVYEFLGELDLVINDLAYKTLDKTGLLAKEFNKK